MIGVKEDRSVVNVVCEPAQREEVRLTAVLRALIGHHLGPDIDDAAHRLMVLLDLLERERWQGPYGPRVVPPAD